MKRPLLFCIGVIATALAIIGVWTPGLPTTPLLIVALWAFAGSSKRLHSWLSRAPIFKVAMIHAKEFQEKRAIKKEVKTISQLSAWASFLVVLYIFGFPSVVTVAVFLTALLCSVAMRYLKTS